MNKIKYKNINNKTINKILFKNKKNISDIEVKKINEINIEERIERINNVNLKKIQQISKKNYHDNIKNNMINYIKNNNNNKLYYLWLIQFNEEDYNQEKINKTRENAIYHKIWDSIIKEDCDFEVIY